VKGKGKKGSAPNPKDQGLLGDTTLKPKDGSLLAGNNMVLEKGDGVGDVGMADAAGNAIPIHNPDSPIDAPSGDELVMEDPETLSDIEEIGRGRTRRAFYTEGDLQNGRSSSRVRSQKRKESDDKIDELPKFAQGLASLEPAEPHLEKHLTNQSRSTYSQSRVNLEKQTIQNSDYGSQMVSMLIFFVNGSRIFDEIYDKLATSADRHELPRDWVEDAVQKARKPVHPTSYNGLSVLYSNQSIAENMFMCFVHTKIKPVIWTLKHQKYISGSVYHRAMWEQTKNMYKESTLRGRVVPVEKKPQVLETFNENVPVTLPELLELVVAPFGTYKGILPAQTGVFLSIADTIKEPKRFDVVLEQHIRELDDNSKIDTANRSEIICSISAAVHFYNLANQKQNDNSGLTTDMFTTADRKRISSKNITSKNNLFFSSHGIVRISKGAFVPTTEPELECFIQHDKFDLDNIVEMTRDDGSKYYQYNSAYACGVRPTFTNANTPAEDYDSLVNEIDMVTPQYNYYRISKVICWSTKSLTYFVVDRSVNAVLEQQSPGGPFEAINGRNDAWQLDTESMQAIRAVIMKKISFTAAAAEIAKSKFVKIRESLGTRFEKLKKQNEEVHEDHNQVTKDSQNLARLATLSAGLSKSLIDSLDKLKQLSDAGVAATDQSFQQVLVDIEECKKKSKAVESDHQQAVAKVTSHKLLEKPEWNDGTTTARRKAPAKFGMNVKGFKSMAVVQIFLAICISFMAINFVSAEASVNNSNDTDYSETAEDSIWEQAIIPEMMQPLELGILHYADNTTAISFYGTTEHYNRLLSELGYAVIQNPIVEYNVEAASELQIDSASNVMSLHSVHNLSAANHFATHITVQTPINFQQQASALQIASHIVRMNSGAPVMVNVNMEMDNSETSNTATTDMGVTQGESQLNLQVPGLNEWLEENFPDEFRNSLTGTGNDDVTRPYDLIDVSSLTHAVQSFSNECFEYEGAWYDNLPLESQEALHQGVATVALPMLVGLYRIEGSMIDIRRAFDQMSPQYYRFLFQMLLNLEFDAVLDFLVCVDTRDEIPIVSSGGINRGWFHIGNIAMHDIMQTADFVMDFVDGVPRFYSLQRTPVTLLIQHPERILEDIVWSAGGGVVPAGTKKKRLKAFKPDLRHSDIERPHAPNMSDLGNFRNLELYSMSYENVNGKSFRSLGTSRRLMKIAKASTFTKVVELQVGEDFSPYESQPIETTIIQYGAELVNRSGRENSESAVKAQQVKFSNSRTAIAKDLVSHEGFTSVIPKLTRFGSSIDGRKWRHVSELHIEICNKRRRGIPYCEKIFESDLNSDDTDSLCDDSSMEANQNTDMPKVIPIQKTGDPVEAKLFKSNVCLEAKLNKKGDQSPNETEENRNFLDQQERYFTNKILVIRCGRVAIMINHPRLALQIMPFIRSNSLHKVVNASPLELTVRFNHVSVGAFYAPHTGFPMWRGDFFSGLGETFRKVNTGVPSFWFGDTNSSISRLTPMRACVGPLLPEYSSDESKLYQDTLNSALMVLVNSFSSARQYFKQFIHSLNLVTPSQYDKIQESDGSNLHNPKSPQYFEEDPEKPGQRVKMYRDVQDGTKKKLRVHRIYDPDNIYPTQRADCTNNTDEIARKYREHCYTECLTMSESNRLRLYDQDMFTFMNRSATATSNHRPYKLDSFVTRIRDSKMVLGWGTVPLLGGDDHLVLTAKVLVPRMYVTTDYVKKTKHTLQNVGAQGWRPKKSFAASHISKVVRCCIDTSQISRLNEAIDRAVSEVVEDVKWDNAPTDTEILATKQEYSFLNLQRRDEIDVAGLAQVVAKVQSPFEPLFQESEFNSTRFNAAKIDAMNVPLGRGLPPEVNLCDAVKQIRLVDAVVDAINKTAADQEIKICNDIDKKAYYNDPVVLANTMRGMTSSEYWDFIKSTNNTTHEFQKRRGRDKLKKFGLVNDAKEPNVEESADWFEGLTDLLRPINPEFIAEVENQVPEVDSWWQTYLEAPFQESEVKAAQQRMKKLGVFSYIADSPTLLFIFNMWRDYEYATTNSLSSLMVLIYKKLGSMMDPNSFRAVVIAKQLIKIYSRMIVSRAETVTRLNSKPVLDQTQIARPSRSAAEVGVAARNVEVAAAKMMIANRGKGMKEAFKKCLFDIRKAFPTLDFALCVLVMNAMKFPRWIVAAIHVIHRCTIYRIKGNEGESRQFFLSSGLKEGDSSSSPLFSICHTMVMRVLRRRFYLSIAQFRQQQKINRVLGDEFVGFDILKNLIFRTDQEDVKSNINNATDVNPMLSNVSLTSKNPVNLLLSNLKNGQWGFHEAVKDNLGCRKVLDSEALVVKTDAIRRITEQRLSYDPAISGERSRIKQAMGKVQLQSYYDNLPHLPDTIYLNNRHISNFERQYVCKDINNCIVDALGGEALALPFFLIRRDGYTLEPSDVHHFRKYGTPNTYCTQVQLFDEIFVDDTSIYVPSRYEELLKLLFRWVNGEANNEVAESKYRSLSVPSCYSGEDERVVGFFQSCFNQVRHVIGKGKKAYGCFAKSAEKIPLSAPSKGQLMVSMVRSVTSYGCNVGGIAKSLHGENGVMQNFESELMSQALHKKRNLKKMAILSAGGVVKESELPVFQDLLLQWRVFPWHVHMMTSVLKLAGHTIRDVDLTKMSRASTVGMLVLPGEMMTPKLQSQLRYIEREARILNDQEFEKMQMAHDSLKEKRRRVHRFKICKIQEALERRRRIVLSSNLNHTPQQPLLDDSGRKSRIMKRRRDLSSTGKKVVRVAYKIDGSNELRDRIAADTDFLVSVISGSKWDFRSMSFLKQRPSLQQVLRKPPNCFINFDKAKVSSLLAKIMEMGKVKDDAAIQPEDVIEVELMLGFASTLGVHFDSGMRVKTILENGAIQEHNDNIIRKMNKILVGDNVIKMNEQILISSQQANSIFRQRKLERKPIVLQIKRCPSAVGMVKEKDGDNWVFPPDGTDLLGGEVEKSLQIPKTAKEVKPVKMKKKVTFHDENDAISSVKFVEKVFLEDIEEQLKISEGKVGNEIGDNTLNGTPGNGQSIHFDASIEILDPKKLEAMGKQERRDALLGFAGQRSNFDPDEIIDHVFGDGLRVHDVIEAGSILTTATNVINDLLVNVECIKWPVGYERKITTDMVITFMYNRTLWTKFVKTYQYQESVAFFCKARGYEEEKVKKIVLAMMKIKSAAWLSFTPIEVIFVSHIITVFTDDNRPDIQRANELVAIYNGEFVSSYASSTSVLEYKKLVHGPNFSIFGFYMLEALGIFSQVSDENTTASTGSGIKDANRKQEPDVTEKYHFKCNFCERRVTLKNFCEHLSEHKEKLLCKDVAQQLVDKGYFPPISKKREEAMKISFSRNSKLSEQAALLLAKKMRCPYPEVEDVSGWCSNRRYDYERSMFLYKHRESGKEVYMEKTGKWKYDQPQLPPGQRQIFEEKIKQDDGITRNNTALMSTKPETITKDKILAAKDRTGLLNDVLSGAVQKQLQEQKTEPEPKLKRRKLDELSLSARAVKEFKNSVVKCEVSNANIQDAKKFSDDNLPPGVRRVVLNNREKYYSATFTPGFVFYENHDGHSDFVEKPKFVVHCKSIVEAMIMHQRMAKAKDHEIVNFLKYIEGEKHRTTLLSAMTVFKNNKAAKKKIFADSDDDSNAEGERDPKRRRIGKAVTGSTVNIDKTRAVDMIASNSNKAKFADIESTLPRGVVCSSDRSSLIVIVHRNYDASSDAKKAIILNRYIKTKDRTEQQIYKESLRVLEVFRNEQDIDKLYDYETVLALNPQSIINLFRLFPLHLAKVMGKPFYYKVAESAARNTIDGTLPTKNYLTQALKESEQESKPGRPTMNSKTTNDNCEPGSKRPKHE